MSVHVGSADGRWIPVGTSEVSQNEIPRNDRGSQAVRRSCSRRHKSLFHAPKKGCCTRQHRWPPTPTNRLHARKMLTTYEVPEV